jgi:hypothetical protein
VLRDSTVVSVALAALSVAGGLITAHPVAGFGMGAGLLIGSFNGRLVVATLEHRVPFALASVARLVLLSAIAIGLATLLGPSAWSVLIGVAAAQLVMVGTAIRQGLRA